MTLFNHKQSRSLSSSIHGGDPVYVMLRVKNTGERALEDGYVTIRFISKDNSFSYKGGTVHHPTINFGEERDIPLIIKTEGAGNIFLTPGFHGSPYQAALEKAVGIMAASERDGIAMDVVAAEVLALLTARRPPLRRVVDWRYRLIRLAKRLLPDALLEWIVVKMHS